MKFEKPVVIVDKFELVDTIASSGGAATTEENPYYGVFNGETFVAYGSECRMGG